MNIDLKNSKEHGPYVTIDEWGVADQLDDYLGEKEYVLYNRSTSKGDSGVEVFEFWFGKAASEEKLKDIIERFKESI